MITLYGPAQAPFTEKVRRALLYKKLDFELRQPGGPEDYKRWSPKTGLLPVLDLDGEHVPDSTDILLRLDALYPEPPLVSSDPTVAGQQRQLEDWADQSFSWHFNRYRRIVAEASGVTSSERPRAELLGRLLAWLRTGGTWERPLTGLLRDLGLRLDDLVNFLGSRPFFYAERMSMADLSVYGMLFTMRADFIPGSARLLEERRPLQGLMERVEMATGG